MTETEFLRQNYFEETPSWLMKFKKGDNAPLRQFLDSRTVFYPGARDDRESITVFGRSHSAHCFIHVDYKYSREQMLKGLRENPVEGYSILDQVDIPESTMRREAPLRKANLTPFEQEQALDGYKQFCDMPPFGDCFTPYAIMTILERKPSLTDEFGPKRLALLYMLADGVATLDAFYGNKNANFFGYYLKDHGYGCNYDRWGKGGICEAIANRTDSFPALIFLADSTLWDGYKRISGEDAKPRLCKKIG